MAFSSERRPLDCSLPHELTCETPCPSLKLYFLIGILSLSALSIALLIYLCVLLSRTSKKREVPAKGTNSRESDGPFYEVFLSFHGRDNRHGFTDFLYRGMVETGILVFRDNESLHVGQRIGDELLQAIQNSKIYVPIFSENYASSHWCLRELAYMVECTSKSNGKKEILPIFLDVEPDDVKLKTDLYRKDLSAHQKKFRTEVESWKKALIEVDEIKGWNWRKDEGQADLTQSIIKTVLDKLKVRYKRIVPEDLVGIDDRVEAIIKMLDLRSSSVQFLGIHGMGGIGKTTLANVIFNCLSSHFKDCYFLPDVRELSQKITFGIFERADIVATMERYNNEMADCFMAKAKKICHDFGRGGNERENGDARDVIYRRAQKLVPDVLVMGSHGYSLIKRGKTCIM